LFTPTEFSRAIDSAMSQLQAAQQALRESTCSQIAPLTINLSELSDKRIGEMLDTLPMGYGKSEKGYDYIYVIQVQDEQAGVVTKLRAQLEEAKKTLHDYSKINSENKETKTLYVGRSKTLRARLKQHLGTEGRGVYSLHLQRWATGNNAEIAVFIMKFNSVESSLIQTVEDTLWAYLKPAFGRKGER